MVNTQVTQSKYTKPNQLLYW